MKKLYISIGLIVVVLSAFFFIDMYVNKGGKDFPQGEISVSSNFQDFPLQESVKANIDLDLLVGGGPDRDDIPAINNPKFYSIPETLLKDKDLGVLVNFNDEQKYYPYELMVWHEIVNDSIGEIDYAVTFCPLCGASVVFNRKVNGELLDFGVSGFLFESNLVMYDQQTESFWSQVRGDSIVGDYVGTKLEVLPMQLISFAELKEKYPKAKILNKDTGFKRDYGINPYASYEQNDKLYKEVSNFDDRYPLKEVMYVVEAGDQNVIFSFMEMEDGRLYEFELSESEVLSAQKNGEEIITKINNKQAPGFYSMWFSWVAHYKDTGRVWGLQ
jgi:hypothetical protein